MPFFMTQSDIYKYITKIGHILDCVYDAIIAVDPNGVIIYVNPGYTRNLGVAVDEILGKNIKDLSPKSVIVQVLKTRKAIVEQPSRVERLGIDIVSNATPIYDREEFIGAISVFREVREIERLYESCVRMRELIQYLQKELDEKIDLPKCFNEIIGRSPQLLSTLRMSAKVAATDSTLLILGESGVGKEALAKAIHNSSLRKGEPFIQVNCAAIPDTLLESELFGYEGGAFSGALKGGKPGKFELAHKGTLLLDEIGEISINVQAKLLRAVQSGEIERIGGTKPRQLDVRIIAATNQNLEKAILEKRFREDLYYRLNVVSITIPPLRERQGDVKLLMDHFISRFSEKHRKKVAMTKETMDFLVNYNWPGNVRELQNTIEHAVIMSEKGIIQNKDLPNHFFSFQEPSISPLRSSTDLNLRKILEEVEKETIIKALEICKNNKSEAMNILGISRYTFYDRLRRLGISSEDPGKVYLAPISRNQ